MTIAIDFDQTWTEDPKLWRAFYTFARNVRGHNIIIATGRKAHSSDMDRYGLIKEIPVVYCGDTPKRRACLAAGYKVDVWIDDTPAMVDGNLTMNHDSEL